MKHSEILKEILNELEMQSATYNEDEKNVYICIAAKRIANREGQMLAGLQISDRVSDFINPEPDSRPHIMTYPSYLFDSLEISYPSKGKRLYGDMFSAGKEMLFFLRKKLVEFLIAEYESKGM